MRRFEFKDGKSNKFWAVAVDGSKFTMHYGRIGTEGKTQTKSAASPGDANRAVEKLVSEKLDKGYVEVAAEKTTMNEAVFWELISKFNWKKLGDDDEVMAPASKALARMAVKELYAFDDILAAKLYALDTREVARGVYRGQLNPDDGDDYISADDFLYVRCVIVANGKKFYESVLADPMTAPQDVEFESLLYLVQSAFEAKTGDEYEHSPELSWESFSNTEGWKPTKKTKPGRFTAASVPVMNRRPT